MNFGASYCNTSYYSVEVSGKRCTAETKPQKNRGIDGSNASTRVVSCDSLLLSAYEVAGYNVLGVSEVAIKSCEGSYNNSTQDAERVNIKIDVITRMRARVPHKFRKKQYA